HDSPEARDEAGIRCHRLARRWGIDDATVIEFAREDGLERAAFGGNVRGPNSAAEWSRLGEAQASGDLSLLGSAGSAPRPTAVQPAATGGSNTSAQSCSCRRTMRPAS